MILGSKTSHLELFLKDQNIPVTHISYQGKKDLIKTFFAVYKYLRKHKVDCVHTHLFDANLIGLLAGKFVGIKKRIYTRHHSSLHHHYFPRAVYYDRLINYLATDIVAITKTVESILIEWEKVKKKKIHLIHHGFNLELFKNPSLKSIYKIREKYQINDQYPIIGVIARYTHWKGIQFIIPAFQTLLKNYPNAHLILANANGDYKKEIQELLAKLPKENYTEIPFEHDIASLYQLFNVYVHTPINEHAEAFGQTYVEALASGIPSIFTLSGIASEFIKDGKNSLVVPYQDSEEIASKLHSLLSDKNLAESFVQQGKESVSPFSIDLFIENLSRLYQ